MPSPGRPAWRSPPRARHQRQAGDRVAAGVHWRCTPRWTPGAAPTLTLYRDGSVAAMATGSRLDYQADGAPAVYRVEATLPVRRGGGPLAPWLVSNPIYVGPAVPWARRSAATGGVEGDLSGRRVATRRGTQRPSDGAVTVVGAEGGTQLSLRFALGGKLSDAPFVAFAVRRARIGYTAVSFSGRAIRPRGSRCSCARRRSRAVDGGGNRVYLDEMPRTVTLRSRSSGPAVNGLAAAPPLAPPSRRCGSCSTR
jgi:hypothetical protein